MGLRATLRRWRGRSPAAPDVEPPAANGHGGPTPSGVATPRLVLGGTGRAPEPDPHATTASAPVPSAGPSSVPSSEPPPDPQPGPSARALAEAWSMVSSRTEPLVVRFYAELFARLPEAPSMFPSSMTGQRAEFGAALVQWVGAPDRAALAEALRRLGDDHRKFAVEARHYDVAGDALIAAWAHTAGDRWSARHQEAVLASYRQLSQIMLTGAAEHADEPAWWDATVVEHRRVLPDFAVLRIEPDQPYPYRPGQYLTLELPSHRREWRKMSIATAPGPDNRFDLHVRSGPGIGVGAALVNHTSAGTRLRLGPPRGGELVVDPGAAPGGLLCIAAGAGAAPISAVVESVLHWREPPPLLEVFIGGRNRVDAFSVDVLNRMIDATPRAGRAAAHAVLSDDTGADPGGDPGADVGFRGRVETVVPPLRDWAGLGVDVLVAGPDAMIEATVTNLTRHRVPARKIHFDEFVTR